MRIVIAPDKLKDCLSAIAAAEAIAQGVRDAAPAARVDLCPMADGGEGTVDALVRATSGRTLTKPVTGPLPGMRVEAAIGLIDDGRTAVLEMASASGLALLTPAQRNPMRTTSYGTGELLRHAALLGVQKIIMGIGGSATVDGGLGLLQAWGFPIVLQTGTRYGRGDRKMVGGDLPSVLRVETPHAPGGNGDRGIVPTRKGRSARRPPRTGQPHSEFEGDGEGDAEIIPGHPTPPDKLPPPVKPQIVVACDVGNPLYGDNGAAAIFGPQKGATPEHVRVLDAGLRLLADRVGKRSEATRPGAGAAGGMGFALSAILGAELRSGIEIVIDAVGLERRLKGADLCITAEGRLDGQTAAGKTIAGVADLCRRLGVPCIALAGSVEDGADALIDSGVTAFFSICNRPMPLDDALRDGGPLLRRSAANILRLWRAQR